MVVAYGHLLPTALLTELPRGFVNVHASLLPRWRGAAPIHWALLAGDAETGVSIMRVEAGLDTGGVWLERRIPIGERDTTGSLFRRLATVGAAALLDALPLVAAGEAPRPQDERHATLAPRIDRETARIHWDEPAVSVACRIRAMDPAPGAWSSADGHEYKMFGARLHPLPADSAAVAPGDIVAAGGELLVAAGDVAQHHAVAIDEIQPSGRRRMTAAEWLRGQQAPPRRFS